MSVSPEIARRVEEQKAKEKALKKRPETELGQFHVAERATAATGKVQRKVTTGPKTWMAEKLTELLALSAKHVTIRKRPKIGHRVT
jgi:hypothetical protein